MNPDPTQTVFTAIRRAIYRRLAQQSSELSGASADVDAPVDSLIRFIRRNRGLVLRRVIEALLLRDSIRLNGGQS